jgi:hypothetical protein
MTKETWKTKQTFSVPDFTTDKKGWINAYKYKDFVELEEAEKEVARLKKNLRTKNKLLREAAGNLLLNETCADEMSELSCRIIQHLKGRPE